ncbi:hypothetical protein ACFOY8_14180 [Thalassospira xianhensis]|uniref:hypothetical protein n=1 Tax=Thalassospira xianhensis TaxID=478503 RepID=UPI0011BD45E1|nr:hypothetical protein [Thalassospira xianhensis]
MKIQGFINEKEVSLDISNTDGMGLEELLKAVCSSKQVSAIVHELAASCSPRRYSRENYGRKVDFGKMFLRSVVDDALSNYDTFPVGEAVKDALYDEVDRWDPGYYEDLYEDKLQKKPEFTAIRDFFTTTVFVAANADTLDDDNQGILDDVLEAEFYHALESAELGAPVDMLDDRHTVELCYIPGYDENVIGVMCGNDKVDIKEILQFFGWTEEEYRDAQSLGEDIDAGVKPANRILSFSQLQEFTNDQHRGSLVFACQMRIKDIINHDWQKPLKVSGGALVGIHRFSKGKGYMVKPDFSEFVLPACPQDWYMSEGRGKRRISEAYPDKADGLLVSVETIDEAPRAAPDLDVKAGPSV